MKKYDINVKQFQRKREDFSDEHLQKEGIDQHHSAFDAGLGESPDAVQPAHSDLSRAASARKGEILICPNLLASTGRFHWFGTGMTSGIVDPGIPTKKSTAA